MNESRERKWGNQPHHMKPWNVLMDELHSGISPVTLGPYFSYSVKTDMKHLLFTFARYKFVYQMLTNNPEQTLLELGCNEGFLSVFVAEKAKVLGVDFDEKAIEWGNSHYASDRLSFKYDDFLGQKYGEFDAVASLDVIEHIEREKEDLYLKTIHDNVKETGFAVVGTPNISATPYMSEGSRLAHVNLFSQERLKELLLKAFNNVFMFGMNDEVLHTGFAPMCHYILALACGKRSDKSVSIN
jgi:SAM-dependent methyltransferase